MSWPKSPSIILNQIFDDISVTCLAVNLAEAIPFLSAQKVAKRLGYGFQLPTPVLLGRFECLLLCRSHLSLLEVPKNSKGNKSE